METDKLSETLKNTIERTNQMKLELNAVGNLVEQYENANKRIMSEMEEQAL